MNVAQEILRQLGGNKFVAMTGAKNLLATDTGLCFKLPSGFAKQGINYIEIDLTSMDDYTMSFLKFKAGNVQSIAYKDGIYCDMLASTFTDVTGLDTRL